MKTTVGVASFSFLCVGASTASAQDAWRNSTMIVSERFTWSGVYAGAQGGFGQVDAQAIHNNAVLLTAKPGGGFGGGHIGFNHQVEHLVFGLEGDLEASGIRRVYRFGVDSGTLSSRWMGSVRGRFGMAYDRLLFYVTAGLAIADGRVRADVPTAGVMFKGSETFYGYTLGFGLEYAFSRHFSVRAEWRTTHFQPKTYSVLAAGDSRLELDAQTYRLGASYRF